MSTSEAIKVMKQMKAEASSLRRNNDIEGAMANLGAGIKAGRDALALDCRSSPGDDAKQLAWDLADCLGMLGGNLLRQKRVIEAIDVFREGRDIETSDIYQIGLTYNTVNLLVARVLAAGTQGLQESRTELLAVIVKLKNRVARDAADDLWAWADLGMCEFLNGDFAAARSAYAKAASLATAEDRRSVLARLLMVKVNGGATAAGAEAFCDEIRSILG